MTQKIRILQITAFVEDIDSLNGNKSQGGLNFLVPFLGIIFLEPASHPPHQLALKATSFYQQNNFLPRFFTSSTGVVSAFNFYVHFPHYMSFLFCFPLYTYLVFAWFCAQFLLLSLSSNFTAFSVHVAGTKSA